MRDLWNLWQSGTETSLRVPAQSSVAQGRQQVELTERIGHRIGQPKDERLFSAAWEFRNFGLTSFSNSVGY